MTKGTALLLVASDFQLDRSRQRWQGYPCVAWSPVCRPIIAASAEIISESAESLFGEVLKPFFDSIDPSRTWARQYYCDAMRCILLLSLTEGEPDEAARVHHSARGTAL
jgi:hypothetical protein